MTSNNSPSRKNKNKGLGEDGAANFIATEVRDALQYTDSEIAPRREKNYRYYNGDMSNLKTKPGQSRVVDSTVADNINLILPSLLRIFTTGPRVFEYDPSPGVDENLVNIVTDFVNEVVIRKDNRGENMLWQWGFDAMTQIVGMLKVWWEEDKEVTSETYEGLTPEEFLQIAMRVEPLETEDITAYSEDVNEDGQIEVSITVEKTINRSHVCIEPIPPEEFVISRDARSLEDAVLRSHRTSKRVGDLIDLGYDPELIKSLPVEVEHEFTRERLSRNFETDQHRSFDADPMMREVALHEGVIRCDYDGSGIKEWWFRAAGSSDNVQILDMEAYDCQMFFVDFCPTPLPHKFYGRCPADDLVENQEVSTVLQRQMLDNLYLTNRPKLSVVTSQLEKGQMDAVLSYGAGQPVGVKAQGALTPLTVPFMAQHALTGLQYYADLSEKRSGVSRQSMGLNPEALANQSATSANIAYDASMGKIEQYARIWAHGGMRKLGRAILKTLIKYQDFERIVRLRGAEQRIDPREWEDLSDLDVNVTTGLGSGTKERDLQGLSLVGSFQEKVIMNLGLDNPVVKLHQLINTYRDSATCMGFDPDKYFTEVPPDYQMPQPEPQPDPKMLEMQAKIQQGQQKLQLEAQKLQQSGQLDAAKIQIEARRLALEEAKVQLQAGQGASEVDIASLQMKYEEMLMKDAREREKNANTYDLKASELVAEIELEKMAIQAKAPSGNGVIPN